MSTATIDTPTVNTAFVTGRTAQVVGWVVTTLVTLFLGF